MGSFEPSGLVSMRSTPPLVSALSPAEAASGILCDFRDSMILAREQLLRSLESPFGIYQSIKNGQHMAAIGDHSG
jgi:hypothetical protein